MSRKFKRFTETVTFEKLLDTGQALARLADGRVVLAFDALPEESSVIEVHKKRGGVLLGSVKEIIKKSQYRIEPKESHFLATAPWQILEFDEENRQKATILLEALRREKIQFDKLAETVITCTEDYGYRNKMEYSFWADADGLHLAQYLRGTHQKIIVTQSLLADPSINQVASAIIAILNQHNIRGSILKSLILRCNEEHQVVASLFCKEKIDLDFEIDQVPNLQGFELIYSDPLSPASVCTEIVWIKGNLSLTDKLLDHQFNYSSRGFFQVNLPIYRLALAQIKSWVADSGMKSVTDLYCGVGSIGIESGADNLQLIELDTAEQDNLKLNLANAKIAKSEILIADTASEDALSMINNQDILIVDPPRSGLHKKVVQKIIDIKPKMIIYLSCNVSTFARDLSLLQSDYNIEDIKGYNFFPRTPHIESLALLNLK